MTLSTELPKDHADRSASSFIRLAQVPVHVYSGLTIGVIIGLWWLAAAYQLVSPVFLPSPPVVLKAAWQLVTVGFVDSTLAEHVAASLQRILGGLGVSVLIGVPAALPSVPAGSVAASSIRLSNSCGRCHPWPTCR